MKKITAVTLACTGLVCAINLLSVTAQQPTVTLYAQNKYRGGERSACLNLSSGALESHSKSNRCDVFYGLLELGEERDWFQSSGAQGHRSVIRDLGKLDWTASFTVPVVAALPKLKPGEQRPVSICALGEEVAEVADSASNILNCSPVLNCSPQKVVVGADGVAGPEITPVSASVAVPNTRLKHYRKPKIDPRFVIARAGHMYVIHVVDDVNDFYALFRVESLERGDNCTISWQLIPAPNSVITNNK